MKQYRTEIKWALIFAVVSLLWVLTEKLIGLHDKYLEIQQNTSLLFFIPMIAIYFLSVYEKKRKYYHGDMTYLQGLGSGLFLTVGILILTPLIQFISNFIISPDYYKNLIALMVKSGTQTQEEAEKYFTFGHFLFTNLMEKTITGAVFAAFAPILAKSPKESI